MVWNNFQKKLRIFQVSGRAGEQRFPQLQTLKNYEYYKLFNVVGNNFQKKTTNISSCWLGRRETISPVSNAKKLRIFQAPWCSDWGQGGWDWVRVRRFQDKKIQVDPHPAQIQRKSSTNPAPAPARTSAGPEDWLWRMKSECSLRLSRSPWSSLNSLSLAYSLPYFLIKLPPEKTLISWNWSTLAKNIFYINMTRRNVRNFFFSFL